MREILFRGKLKVDNGEHKKGDWVFGDLVRIKDGEKTSTMIYGFGEVDPSTVGQYTDLTDKNGKKIFEGDIVKFSYDENDENPTFCSIEWKSDRACFGYLETADKMIEVDSLHCEVIGNIHDNPELLGGGNGGRIKTVSVLRQ